MIKRAILAIIMIISTFSVFSFKDNATAKETSFISYYSDKFNGKKTSSGEIFDNSKLTAANRILPFGTKIKMTNIKNGKSVVVRINDRGPFHSSRKLDVSKAAFSAIGNPSQGVLTVEYEVVD